MGKTLRQRLKPRTRWNRFRDMGFATAFTIWRHGLWAPGSKTGGIYTVRPQRLAEFPLHVRIGTSDRSVFRQIFLDREYQPLDNLRNISLVLDCGANVGYSSAYFLSRFPQCRVIAVEPDPANFAMLQKNLAPYGARATAIHAGVWSSKGRLVISEDSFRDGKEWARQVRLARPGEASAFEAVDIPSLLAMSGEERISILKMDIEGAEAEVFAGDITSWLPKVDAIAIELHNDAVFGDGYAVFEKAMAGQPFSRSTSQELVLCVRQK